MVNYKFHCNTDEPCYILHLVNLSSNHILFFFSSFVIGFLAAISVLNNFISKEFLLFLDY